MAAPDLLAGRTLKEICDDTGLLLSRYDFDDLHKDGGFQKTCCVAGGLDDDGVCALDWPFSDVPSCSAYDELRNHIFARYGFPFTKDQWKKRFASEPWYVPRADFNERWLTPAAQRNVKRLLQLKANHQACSPD